MKIHKVEFSARACTGLALAALLAPAVGFSGMHEFHPETLSAPFILLMLEARLRRMPGLHFVWFLLALMCKENVALMLAWMCAVHWVLERLRGRDWQVSMNVFPGIVALVWVLAYGLWLGPKWNGGSVDYGVLYAPLHGEGGIVRNSFAALWRGVTQGNLVWGLLLPFLFLPVLRIRWIIIAAPLFLQHLLSFRSSEWEIHWHYGAPLVALMLFAAIEASARLFWRDAVATYLVVACVVTQLWFGPLRWMGRTLAGAGAAWRSSRVNAELVAAVPDGASVTASLGFLSHVAKREKLQSLQLVLMGLHTLGRKRFTPQPTDHALVDYADRYTFSVEAGSHHPKMKTVTGEIVPSSDELMHRWLKDTGLFPASVRNACAHFHRAAPNGSKLPVGTSRRLDDKTQLVSIVPSTPNGDDLLRWNITWEFAADRTFIPWMKLWLRSTSGENHYILKGAALPGAELGQFVETWTVQRPNIAPGKYTGVLMIFDPLDAAGKGPFPPIAFNVGELEIK